MKTRFVLAGLLVSMMVVEASAQRAEYDDMYFRGADREKNKAIEVEESYSVKTKNQKPDDRMVEEEDNTNPTDSYSARNVNPEYISRSNAEQASEDEGNYYLEGYTPGSTSSGNNFNNSYYNNANWARNSYYANSSMWNSPYYGGMSFYDPWMSPAYGYGSPYGGWGTGWSIALMYGNAWGPYGGYGMYNPYSYGYNPYYGGYGYPGYYGGNNYYYESPRVVNYGKRPTRHSAVTQPTERVVSRSRNTAAGNPTSVVSGNTNRQRQTQDEYYVRPSRRSTSTMDQSTQRNPRNTHNNSWTPPSTQPSRSRDTYDPPTRSSSPSYTPSSTPSYSPSRSSGGSGGGGGSSPRPRGRG